MTEPDLDSLLLAGSSDERFVYYVSEIYNSALSRLISEKHSDMAMDFAATVGSGLSKLTKDYDHDLFMNVMEFDEHYTKAEMELVPEIDFLADAYRIEQVIGNLEHLKNARIALRERMKNVWDPSYVVDEDALLPLPKAQKMKIDWDKVDNARMAEYFVEQSLGQTDSDEDPRDLYKALEVRLTTLEQYSSSLKPAAKLAESYKLRIDNLKTFYDFEKRA